MGCVSARVIPDDEVKQPLKKREKNPSIISGDITKKIEAKFERERAMKLRQHDRVAAAEEISFKTLEEKERLSLGTRSRGTSRVSSRSGSPTQTRKVHFKGEEKVDEKNNKNKEEQTKTNSVQSETLQNGNVDKHYIKPKKKKREKNSVKPSSEKTDSYQPITNNNTDELVNHELIQYERLSTIDERASSRTSGKSEETKR